MAEPIGIASGLVALATFAFQASTTLYKTIQSFKVHSTRVRDVQLELEALSEVLNSLSANVAAATDGSLSALNLPLLRCGKACQEFEQELLKCSSRSGGNRTSFRDWTRLRYMGDNIDGFKQQLAAYKSTIVIALTDVNIRNTVVNKESLDAYTDLVQTATEDLEAHLQSIDEKLEAVLGNAATASGPEAAEVRLIKEERLSTQKCLQICSQLSQHITEMQIVSRGSGNASESAEPGSVPERLTNEGLQECKNSLAATAVKLETHMKDIMDRLVAKSSTATRSEEDRVDLARLRDEWDTTRQCRDICAKADTHLKEKVTIIDNYTVGDGVQFLVSTNDKTINGRNRGLGWRTRQFGGHMSDASLQKISGDYAGGTFRAQNKGDGNLPLRSLGPGNEDDARAGAEFGGRYGPGVKLSSV